jgi:hypothetical protein
MAAAKHQARFLWTYDKGRDGSHFCYSRFLFVPWSNHAITGGTRRSFSLTKGGGMIGPGVVFVIY